MAPTIRSATHADLPAIVAIYNEAGVGTTASYDIEPVDLKNRRIWFDKLKAADFPVLVLEDPAEGGVIGYASFGPFREKAGYAYTVEHSVYVAEGRRAAGAGRMLMTALIDYARGHGVHVMVGVLDAENAASRAFHQRLGFVESAVLPQVGRKFERWLDVVFVTMIFPDGHQHVPFE
ncbi:N-acetyltransferase family protein [Tessaracoccus sp. OS52]|uniref:GNAT family N-acetyltransferase n=1 Tax=Tessaracoccus sp. OS52 TaxID=2886691 RepID=UPI001D121670|nr:GNAT family N-acetyltransferase [Tessaracoccus sp. OS52]MCC2593523.1 N-acetyltransferase family protein [Tessaracoccus sp. OS52]